MANGAERPDGTGGWLPPQAPGAPPAPAPPPPGHHQPPPADADPGNDGAVWGFGLGTAGLVLLVTLPQILFIPALPFAIAGWVVSKRARDKIRRGETAKGRAWADSGYVVGIGTTVLSSIGIVVAILILAID